MLDLERLRLNLDELGLGPWAPNLESLLASRISPEAHGKFTEWNDALGSLPSVERRSADLTSAAVGRPDLELDQSEREAARSALLRLLPWRKGPFALGKIVIDAEWRSNLKWDRIIESIGPLEGRRVLDVGCGNGYYALRMRGLGASLVFGIDPTLQYVMQYYAVAHFFEPQPIHVLPLRLHDLPPATGAFDTVFSMGVLYHQRSPLSHLRQLRDTLRAGGELVLETLVMPGETAYARTPEDRYARMRNVWMLPTVSELSIWLDRCGFTAIRLADVCMTATDEQRSTEWMPFESLQEALDPDDPTQTIEGWPAPRRAIMVASKPQEARKAF